MRRDRILDGPGKVRTPKRINEIIPANPESTTSAIMTQVTIPRSISMSVGFNRL